MLNVFSSIIISALEAYVIVMLSYRCIFWGPSDSNKHSKRDRMILLGLLIMQAQALAATLYDINGPGTHFPLYIRLPIMTLQLILLIRFVV